MDDKKELWPGSGLYLDWENISGEDFDKVEARLEEIGDTPSKILFIERLQADSDFVWRELELKSHFFRREHLLREWNLFGDRLRNKRRHLHDVLRLEQQTEPAAKKEPENEDDQEQEGSPHKRTLRRQVLAIRFLLLAAGFAPSQGEDALAEAARFTAFLLGKEPKAIRSSQIYKIWSRPYVTNNKDRNDDFKYLLELFHSLNLALVTERVKQEIRED